MKFASALTAHTQPRATPDFCRVVLADACPTAGHSQKYGRDASRGKSCSCPQLEHAGCRGKAGSSRRSQERALQGNRIWGKIGLSDHRLHVSVEVVPLSVVAKVHVT